MELKCITAIIDNGLHDKINVINSQNTNDKYGCQTAYKLVEF